MPLSGSLISDPSIRLLIKSVKEHTEPSTKSSISRITSSMLSKNFKTQRPNFKSKASPSLHSDVQHKFYLEISLLKQLNHPHIVNLKEIICSKPNRRNLYRGSTFMVFEYMHHDFAGLFRSKINFSTPEIKSIMKQLI